MVIKWSLEGADVMYVRCPECERTQDVPGYRYAGLFYPDNESDTICEKCGIECDG